MSLTSREASKALRELVTADPTFWAEITQPCSRGGVPHHIPPKLTSHEEQLEDLEETPIDIHGDDSEVLMIDVISAHTNSFNRDSAGFDGDDVDKLYIVGEGGGLVSAADAESACIESVNGRIIDATQAGQLVRGHGRRAKRANVLYSSNFWVTNDGSDEA